MANTTFTCKECEKDFTVEYWWKKVGCDVTCPHCGTIWETDWDYMDYDTVSAWLLNKVGNEKDT